MVTTTTEIYQGQYGEFTITEKDRLGVIIYRLGLTIAAVSFALGATVIFNLENHANFLPFLTPIFVLFSLGLAISLLTIHIYLISLHRLLQLFWLIGTVTSISLASIANESLLLYVYHHPLTLLGIGFIFAALTGIYFKEAFCFNRLETKFLTFLVPILLLGHLLNILPLEVEKLFLAIWVILFIVFAVRKLFQPIPSDIGDKSVFTYLQQQNH